MFRVFFIGMLVMVVLAFGTSAAYAQTNSDMGSGNLMGTASNMLGGLNLTGLSDTVANMMGSSQAGTPADQGTMPLNGIMGGTSNTINGGTTGGSGTTMGTLSNMMSMLNLTWVSDMISGMMGNSTDEGMISNMGGLPLNGMMTGSGVGSMTGSNGGLSGPGMIGYGSWDEMAQAMGYQDAQQMYEAMDSGAMTSGMMMGYSSCDGLAQAMGYQDAQQMFAAMGSGMMTGGNNTMPGGSGNMMGSGSTTTGSGTSSMTGTGGGSMSGNGMM